MRRAAVALVIAGALGIAALWAPFAMAQIADHPNAVFLVDKPFTLDPNDQSTAAADCFDVPNGVLMTVVVWTVEDDTNSESVNIVLKEDQRIVLRTSLTTNPTVVSGYAGAGTYCYWLSALHVHLNVVEPVRHAHLTITADSDMSRWNP